MPSTCLVPPGLTGYVSPAGAPFDVDAARKLLAEAGFPGGRGFPKTEILYNTHFVKFFSFLPPMGNYSPIQLHLLVRR